MIRRYKFVVACLGTAVRVVSQAPLRFGKTIKVPIKGR